MKQWYNGKQKEWLLGEGNTKMVEKSQRERELELLDSLKIVRDMLRGINEGKNHLFIPLCGQLRALLIDGRKRKNGSENKNGNVPLLISIAETIGYETNIYSLPSVDKSEMPFAESLESFYVRPQISMYRQNPKQQKFSIKNWLNIKILESLSRKKEYTLIDVIKFYADQAGGAHYDPIISEDFAELRKYGRMYNLMFDSVLITARVVYEIGLDIIRKRCNFDFFFLLGIPNQTIQSEGFIFDAKHTNTPMRISLCLDSFSRPIFKITSIEGLDLICHCERLIDWSEPRGINLVFEVLDNLGVRASIYIDAELFACIESPEMFFVFNNVTNYNQYINRSYANENDGLLMGICIEEGAYLYGRILNYFDKARCLSRFAYLLKELDGKCRVYKRGYYKHLTPKAQSYSIEVDDVELYTLEDSGVEWNFKKLLDGILPKNFN